MAIDRQIPWRLSRRSVWIALLCLAIGVGCAALLLTADSSRDELEFSIVMALALALACWLAWCAITWHIDMIRRATGPYIVRHAGLLFALPMWSLQFSQFFRQSGAASSPSAKIFWILFAVILPAPFALWGGVALQYISDSILGKRNSS